MPLIFIYHSVTGRSAENAKMGMRKKLLYFENKGLIGLFETLLQNSFQQNKDFTKKEKELPD